MLKKVNTESQKLIDKYERKVVIMGVINGEPTAYSVSEFLEALEYSATFREQLRQCQGLDRDQQDSSEHTKENS